MAFGQIWHPNQERLLEVSSNVHPQGKYALSRRHGDLVFVSGITPRKNGTLVRSGPINAIDDQHCNRELFDLTIGNALKAAESSLRDEEVVTDILQMIVYLAVPDGFNRHSEFADLASDALFSRLPSANPPSRAALGVSSLPSNAPLEIVMTAVVSARQSERGISTS